METKIETIKNKYLMPAKATVAGIASSFGFGVVYADESINAATVISGQDSTTIVGQILGIILKVATFIGSALLIWGLVMFGLAIKNDEPESKQKSLMTAFSGVILISLRAILKAACIIE